MPDAGANPFPGLRPYQDYEASLFFGRKNPAAEIIEKLGSQRFIAVVGTSGSGKSSIVNCGVLPTLYAGFYVPRGSRWKVVRTEPGGEPIRRLAERVSAVLGDRLVAESGNGSGSGNESANPTRDRHVDALSEAILRFDADGLVNLVRQARLPRSDNVLIVVDQFEELFRYRDQHTSPDEAQKFVQLLLRAAEDTSEHIYVMLTMRSDFLGDCMLIPGLPEAINDGLFLVPAMNREERKQAVRGPVKVAGATIEVPLINRILEDIGDELDQLPLLQHALMRTWQEWEADAKEADDVRLRHYLATVRSGSSQAEPTDSPNGSPAAPSDSALEFGPTVIERALDEHAEIVYRSLDPDQRDIARKIFQAITEVDALGRGGRRPRRLGRDPEVSEAERHDLEYVTGVPVEHLKPVIEALRAPDRSFLKPERFQKLESGTEVGEDLVAGSVIDIWHESLIRNWVRLKRWIAEEAKDAEVYTDLARETTRQRPSLTRATLQTAIEWAERRLSDARVDSGTEPPWAPVRRRALGLSSNDVARIEPWASKYERAGTRGGSFEEVVTLFRQKVRQWAGIRYGVRLLTLGAIVALLVFVAAQRNATQDEQRAGRVQLAAALADPLASALVLSEDREEPAPDLFVVDLFESAKPRDIDRILRSVAAAGLPAAALLEESELGHVRSVVFDPSGDSVIIFSQAGLTARISKWPADGNTVPLTLFASASADPVSRAVTKEGRVAARFSNGDIGVLDRDSGDWETVPTLSDSGRSEIGMVDKAGLTSEFSRDGQHVAVVYHSGTDRWLAVWRTERGAAGDSLALPVREAPAQTDFVGFSDDGTRLVTLAHDTPTVWDLASGGAVRCIARGEGERGHEGKIERAAFDAEGGRLVTAGTDGTARIWKVERGGAGLTCTQAGVLDAHLESVNHARFSLDGSRLVTVSDDGLALLWDPGEAEVLCQLRGHRGPVVDVWMSPDGTSFVTADANGSALVWRLTDGQRIQSLHAGTDTARVAFSPGGTTIATAATGGGVRVWPAEPTAIVEPPRLHGHGSPIVALALGRSERITVTGATDGSVMLWDLGRTDSIGNPMPIGDPLLLGDGPIQAVAISLDEEYVAAASGADVGVWSVEDVEAGDTAARQAPHDTDVMALVFSADGRVFTGAQDGQVRAWSIGDGAALALNGSIPPPAPPPDEFPFEILSLAADPMSSRLLVGYDQRCGQLWSEAGSQADSLWASTEQTGGLCTVAFSPTGNRFATAGEKWVSVWHEARDDRDAGRHGADEPEVRLEFVEGGIVAGLVFDPTGSRLVAYDTASAAGLVMWDIRSKSELELLVPETGNLTGAAIGSDGNLRIWVSSSNTSATMWPIDYYREMLHSLRDATTACLTRAQRIAFFGETSDEATMAAAGCAEARRGPSDEVSEETP